MTAWLELLGALVEGGAQDVRSVEEVDMAIWKWQ
jgi:hypothetical protein